MDINIEAVNHPKTATIVENATAELKKSIGKTGLISTCHLLVRRNEQSKIFHISIEVHPNHGRPLFAQDEHLSDMVAVRSCIKKIRKQLDRFREIRYSSSHRNVSKH